MTDTKKICRLCLKTGTLELDETKLQMCTIVLSSIVDMYYNPVICNYCIDSLRHSFDFKTICLGNEDFLNTFLINGDAKLILHEIVPKTSANVIKQEDELPCRLCFKYFGSKLFTDLSRIEDDFFLRDMVENCLPEINLNRTLNPVVCQNCMQSLQNQFNLISTFVDTNDKINDYISYMTLSDNKSAVDLHGVLQFILKITREKIPYGDGEIKLEFSDDAEPHEVHIKLEDNVLLEEQYEEICEDQAAPSNECIKEEAFKKNSQGIYSCNLCPHETTLRCSMRLHQQKHQNTILFKCAECDFITKWRTSMNQHAWLHKDAKMYQCAVCPYKTRYKKHLRRHNKRHGNPDALQEYQCQYCKFTTTDKYYFKLHNRTKHQTEVVLELANSFTCDQCNFVTCKKCLLTKHRNKVHKIKSKRYVCEHCGSQTRSQYHLDEHLLKHKKGNEVAMLQCAKCDFRTKYKRSLRTHLLLH